MSASLASLMSQVLGGSIDVGRLERRSCGAVPKRARFEEAKQKLLITPLSHRMYKPLPFTVRSKHVKSVNIIRFTGHAAMKGQAVCQCE